MRIACLHTAASNIELFEIAAATLQLEAGTLHHVVYSELLQDTEKHGGITPEIAAETLKILEQLATEADAILLNCSTLGPVADQADKLLPISVVRSDRALAEQALQTGHSLTVLCTAPTTLTATSQLFADVFSGSAITPDIRLVGGAWTLFRSGEMSAYYQLIADAADTAYHEGSQLVALAQTSMTDAATLISTGRKVLNVPTAALLRITAQA